MLFQSILDIANNKEIKSIIIQKSEIKGSPIRFQQLLGRLQKDIIGAIEKNDVLNGRLKQLSDSPCDCEKDTMPPSHYPVVLCLILIFIWTFLFIIWIINPHSPFVPLLYSIAAIAQALCI